MAWVQCSVEVDDTTRVSIMGKSLRGESQMMKCKDQRKEARMVMASLRLSLESRYVLDSGVVAPLMLYMLEVLLPSQVCLISSLLDTTSQSFSIFHFPKILSSSQLTSKTRAFDLIMSLGVHGHLLKPILVDDASTVEEEYTQEPYVDKIMEILGTRKQDYLKAQSLSAYYMKFYFPSGRSSQGIAAAGDPESENVSSLAEVRSPGSVYRPEWGVTNGSLLDTPEACQDLLRLRFEQEAKLLRKSVAQVARWDQRIQAQELEIKNLEARLETEAEMKKAAEDKSVGLIKELEDLRARFSDLQVSNEHLSQQVATLQEQVSGEEKLKASFEEFKRYEDERVEQGCAELDARLDALSIDFDEELYPHMLTAIAGAGGS
uniref:Uncharacterized protein n=1 Tax=Tanacetum cinerariifolium TaxID=118510 RepID=A0A6L2JG22_TANCI|nr:hypothetical protein [Tanacetum cinerariifolium]